jgi:flagellar assembly factor FliW
MEAGMEPADTQTIEFPRFGPCTFSPSDVIEFPWGLPGFPNLRRWLALTVETHASFVWLQSIEDRNVALPTTDPYYVFEEYNPKLPPYVIAALDIADASDFTLLCVVVVTENAEEMTMNLMAPIVVNLRTRKARQVMLESSGYSTSHAIPRKEPAPEGQPAS